RGGRRPPKPSKRTIISHEFAARSTAYLNAPTPPKRNDQTRAPPAQPVQAIGSFALPSNALL
ncbi:MAG: hypothetical protein AB7U18_19995, partial [Dehalococcoidia bacterium]